MALKSQIVHITLLSTAQNEDHTSDKPHCLNSPIYRPQTIPPPNIYLQTPELYIDLKQFSVNIQGGHRRSYTNLSQFLCSPWLPGATADNVLTPLQWHLGEEKNAGTG